MKKPSPTTFAFRKHTRSKTRKRIQLLNDSLGEFLAITYDVSESGLSIERKNLPDKLKVGETFSMRLPHKETIERVRVVRDTPQTVGLAFV